MVNGRYYGRDKMHAQAQARDLEELLSDTIIKVAELHERQERADQQIALIPEIKVLLHNVAAAQTVMANSAQSMAETFRRSEDRQEKLEIRYSEATQLIAGRGQIPLKSHYAILGTVLLAALIWVTYETKTEINASLTQLSIGQQKNLEQLAKAKDEVVSKVEEAKDKK